MDISYKDGHITICAIDIFDRMKGDARDEFLDSMSCREQVIKNVADQIISGWTDMMSHGRQSETSDVPNTALDRATREVGKMSGEVARKEIEALEEALASKKDRVSKLENIQSEIRRLVEHRIGWDATQRLMKEAGAF